MRRRRKVDDGVHAERWLVSYADFMTLLFALFVVLFASSHHDNEEIKRVSSALRSGFQELGAFSADASAPNQPITDRAPDIIVAPADATPEARPVGVPAGDSIDVVELKKQLSKALGKEIEHQEIEMRVTPEGFVISLHELGFFNSGEANLLPGAQDKIKRIAAVLMRYGLNMRVEGHSDDVPIHNTSFASNWDLSTARAMAVAMMLLNESGFDPKKMSIAGYGQYHPAASNSTPEGRKANRRVDIVILSRPSPLEVKAH